MTMSAIGPKRTFQHRHPMSAFGGKADIFSSKADTQVLQVANCHFMSALGGKADMARTFRNVCF
jgi:hypothetical protein